MVRLIAFKNIDSEILKPEYRTYDPTTTFMISHNKVKRLLEVEIMTFKASCDEFLVGGILNEKTKKKIKKAVKNLDDNKPVNTSKWVKPDAESIRGELMCNLFLLYVLDKDNPEAQIEIAKEQSKAEILTGILNAHSPKNPQNICNYGCTNPIADLLSELNNRKHMKFFWRELINGKLIQKHGHNAWRGIVANWLRDRVDEMIISIDKGKKPESMKTNKELLKEKKGLRKVVYYSILKLIMKFSPKLLTTKQMKNRMRIICKVRKMILDKEDKNNEQTKNT